MSHKDSSGGRVLQIVEVCVQSAALPTVYNHGWMVPGWPHPISKALIDQSATRLLDKEKWFVADCITSAPVGSYCDPDLALRLAQQSLQDKLTPQTQRALGWAQYRAGQWQDSLATLAGTGGEPEMNDFVRALAYHQLGDAENARACYERASAWLPEYERKWIDRHRQKGIYGVPPPVMLKRWQLEAAETVGVASEPGVSALLRLAKDEQNRALRLEKAGDLLRAEQAMGKSIAAYDSALGGSHLQTIFADSFRRRRSGRWCCGRIRAASRSWR
jgi:tetratricopeptide (TPR) repeat protein